IYISLGGVAGGAFNAFLAPLIFDTVVEYPAVMMLACLARPWGRGAIRPWDWATLAGGDLFAVAAVFIAHSRDSTILAHWEGFDVGMLAAGLLALAGLAAFLLRGRAWMFMAAILILTLSAAKATDRVDVIRTWRGFFGVLRESRLNEPALGGEIHMLAHGTTLHGAQARSPAFRCQPLVYYAHETPIGQVFDAVRAQRPAIRVGAVGLGTGSVAAYSRPADTLTFFEIDPLVVRVATDPRNFTYVTLCAKGQVGFTLGDARLTLRRAPAGVFDILLIDAFSSDSVPAHLLTVEAVRMYLTKLAPGGVIILHLSNRNLDLVGPAQAVALAAGGKALFQSHRADPALPRMWESSEDAVIVARNAEGLAPFIHDARWRPADAHGVRPWTDDYTNLFGALVRRTRQRWAGGP
ncbi:MAG: fused MFS/spermidine synthase, partial [Caulobacteraceae bacterium]|nr:fused MFS/spermidine synthase [Caulobacteraceae bacterium]